jgi:hypothetical protein
MKIKYIKIDNNKHDNTIILVIWKTVHSQAKQLIEFDRSHLEIVIFIFQTNVHLIFILLVISKRSELTCQAENQLWK